MFLNEVDKKAHMRAQFGYKLEITETNWEGEFFQGVSGWLLLLAKHLDYRRVNGKKI